MNFNKKLHKINKMLENGELPRELDFSIQHTEKIDWDKVRYNSFYRSYEFAESKFPAGYDSILGFDKIIEQCIPQHTPLEEIELKQLKQPEIVETEEKNNMEQQYNGFITTNIFR